MFVAFILKMDKIRGKDELNAMHNILYYVQISAGPSGVENQINMKLP